MKAGVRAFKGKGAEKSTEHDFRPHPTHIVGATRERVPRRHRPRSWTGLGDMGKSCGQIHSSRTGAVSFGRMKDETELGFILHPSSFILPTSGPRLNTSADWRS